MYIKHWLGSNSVFLLTKRKSVKIWQIYIGLSAFMRIVFRFAGHKIVTRLLSISAAEITKDKQNIPLKEMSIGIIVVSLGWLC